MGVVVAAFHEQLGGPTGAGVLLRGRFLGLAKRKTSVRVIRSGDCQCRKIS
jgi:hypothetical protein